MIEIDTTLLSFLFAVFGAFYSVLLAAVLYARHRRTSPEGVSTDARFSLMVPARNEETVLLRTLEGILAMEYPASKFEVLVIDDGSTDRTGEVAARFEAAHRGQVAVVRIPDAISGRRKPETLNFGFRHLLRTSRFNGFRDWVIGVFDADGVPDPDLLQKAAFQFRNPKIGAVQASVRIANRARSWLARMQDLEFAAFSRVTQMVRAELLDSASLGGNGQFVRARALYDAAISRKPHRFWRPGAMTEDLELSARLVLRSWRIKHLATSYVHQEGVERLSDLFRQRTRWAWGSLQVFVEYILKLKVVRMRNVPFKKRLDLVMSLSLFLMSPLVMVVWLLTFLDLIRVIDAVNQLPFLVTLAISFGFFPIVTWGMWDQKEYRRPRMVLDLLLFTVYTYHWLPCLYVAALRVIGGDDPKWFKTRRIAEAPARGTRRRRLVDRIASWATAPRVAGLAAFALLAVVAGYLRWVRGGLLDPFEDPYQHWWIAGYTMETGRYYDSFSAMTHGNWLPLYDFGIAALFPLTGIHNMGALKFVSLLFSLGTMALVYRIGRSHSLGAAWAAALLFAFTPSAVLAGTMALPEAPTGFALAAAYYLLFRSPMAVRWRHPLAAAAMAAAVALRYEAWLFVVLMLAYFFVTRRGRVSRGDLLLVATPALLFMGVWLVFTSQWGFLPDTIIAQTSIDPRYKAGIGALEPLSSVLTDFWGGYLSLSLAVVVLGSVYAVKVLRKEFLAFALLAFYVAEVAWIALGFGNPSARYLYVTVPGLTVLAGMAVSDIASVLRKSAVRTRTGPSAPRATAALAVGLLVLVVGATALDARAIAYPSDDPGLFMEAMVRAGDFLRDRPLPDGKLLLSESPIAAYLSGYAPGRMIGSSSLSDNVTNATAYLRETVAYMVLVTVPWYKLRTLYPNLADGVSTADFRLLYDASGPEYDLGAHRVLVYEVVPLPSGGPGP